MDPGLWARIDLERYATMMRVGRNVIVRPEGGVIKRPGLEFIGFAHGPTNTLDRPVRPIAFEFNNEQTYIVYAMQNRIYFSKDGGIILEAMLCSNAANVTMGQDAFGTYVNDSAGGAGNFGLYNANDIIFWSTGGFIECQNRWLRIHPGGGALSTPAPTDTRFYVQDYLTGGNLATSGYVSNGSESLFGLIYFLDNTDGWYSTVDPMELDFTQANDTLYVSHESAPTKVITRTGDTAWTIVPFDPAPSNAAPTVTQSTYANGSDPPSGTDEILYAVTSIETANGTFEESLAFLLTVDSLPTDHPSYVGPGNPKIDAQSMSSANPVRIQWAHVAGNDKYRVYKATSGVYGLLGIVEGTSGTLAYVDEGAAPNLSIAPPLTADIFDAADKYPNAVELAQQRIWFGRTNNLLRDVYGSRSGSLSSFATSTVSTDDDPVELAIVGRSVHEVQHFVPLKDLLILTSDGEWGFDTGDKEGITPSSGLLAQSHWGSSFVKPVLVGESAIFVDYSGHVVRDLAFAIQSDGFASSNLSLFANHLFKQRVVVDQCFSQSPFNVLFQIMSDGQGLFCTYVRDQQVFAWSRVDTNGKMKACAVVNEGGLDNVYVTVERLYGSTTRYTQIERMTMIDPEFVDQGIWLDNAVESNSPVLTLGFCDGSVTVAQTVWEGSTLALHLTTGSALSANELFQFRASAGSPLVAIDGLVFMAEQVSGNRYRLYRAINADPTTRQLFNAETILPSGFFEYGISGLYNDGVGNLYRAHNLNYRAGSVAIRADLTMYTGLTLAAGGQYQFAPTSATYAGKIVAGETYVCEIETLDIDSPTNPITGLPVQVSEILLRFSLAVGFSYGRRRANLLTLSLSQLRTEEDFSMNRLALRGVIPTTPHPEWRRDGRLVIQSEDGFPFSLTAVVPTIEAGTIDAE